MATNVMRITLKAYDHNQIDHAAGKIIETLKKNGAKVSGPVPLPTKKEVVTILRAVHKYKDSREQFEQRTHKRLIDVIAPTQKTIEALTKMDIPTGVAVNLKCFLYYKKEFLFEMSKSLGFIYKSRNMRFEFLVYELAHYRPSRMISDFLEFEIRCRLTGGAKQCI